ncbi:unnamed protein product [Soboliphyme baturini]|uniref:YTH domain-containing protein n=1 Tax=Soboliphyme baturini TaxID=241478 RepID=A0A183IEK9_9BILA|nr:unnamed protein product [Soboliphyme baturini]
MFFRGNSMSQYHTTSTPTCGYLAGRGNPAQPQFSYICLPNTVPPSHLLPNSTSNLMYSTTQANGMFNAQSIIPGLNTVCAPSYSGAPNCYMNPAAAAAPNYAYQLPGYPYANYIYLPTQGVGLNQPSSRPRNKLAVVDPITKKNVLDEMNEATVVAGSAGTDTNEETSNAQLQTGEAVAATSAIDAAIAAVDSFKRGISGLGDESALDTISRNIPVASVDEIHEDLQRQNRIREDFAVDVFKRCVNASSFPTEQRSDSERPTDRTADLRRTLFPTAEGKDSDRLLVSSWKADGAAVMSSTTCSEAIVEPGLQPILPNNVVAPGTVNFVEPSPSVDTVKNAQAIFGKSDFGLRFGDFDSPSEENHVVMDVMNDFERTLPQNGEEISTEIQAVEAQASETEAAGANAESLGSRSIADDVNKLLDTAAVAAMHPTTAVAEPVSGKRLENYIYGKLETSN